MKVGLTLEEALPPQFDSNSSILNKLKSYSVFAGHEISLQGDRGRSFHLLHRELRPRSRHEALDEAHLGHHQHPADPHHPAQARQIPPIQPELLPADHSRRSEFENDPEALGRVDHLRIEQQH